MAPLKIIIVGAGIAGPAAAVGLARNGHDVSIYERSTSTKEIGYAFAITANSDRCLTYLGIDTVSGGAVALERALFMSAKGSLIRERRDEEDAEKAAITDGRTVFAYRPALHKQLMKAAINARVKVQIGVKVTDVDVSKTTITLEGGKEISADLVIAADGVHSVIRPHVTDMGRQIPNVSSGLNAFRFMLSKSIVQNDPITSSLVSKGANMFTWVGESNRKHIIVYPVDHDIQFNVLCAHPEGLSDEEASDADEAAVIAYNQKASAEKVEEIYRNFEPRAVRLLELANPEDFRVWKLVDRDDSPQWSRNYTTLIGDACHPVLPSGFSGASMGIEDAVTLSTLLPIDVKKEDIPDRLALYENLRRPRVARVRDYAREVAAGLENKERAAEYRQFLIAYDAVKYTEEALKRHLGRSR